MAREDHKIDVATEPNKWTVTINGKVHEVVEDKDPIQLSVRTGKVVEQYLDSFGIRSKDAIITINGGKTASVKVR